VRLYQITVKFKITAKVGYKLVTNVFGISPLLVLREMTLEEAKISDTHSLRGIQVPTFLQLLCHKMHQINRLCFKRTKKQIRTNKKIRNFSIFSIFCEYFQKFSKNSYFVFGVEIEETAPQKFLFVSSSLLRLLAL
jgi:hypothetical protein